MKQDFIDQYRHSFYVLEGIINDFDDDAWTSLAYGYIMPARLAFHILHATKYYIEDTSDIHYPDGTLLEGEWLEMETSAFPSREAIIPVLKILSDKSVAWLEAMDLSAANPTFPWAGKTKAGVVMFLLRHTLYHLGELNAMLYVSKNGEAEDNFIKAFYR